MYVAVTFIITLIYFNFSTVFNIDKCTSMVYFDSLETGACFENEIPQSTLQLESKYVILSGFIS